MIKRFARIVVMILALASLAACVGVADQMDIVVPENVTELQTTEPGRSLKAMGYTPVANLICGTRAAEQYGCESQAIGGAVYVACGDTTQLDECGRDLHNRGTSERPNLYVMAGRIIFLEGPHMSKYDNRSYYVIVPDVYQDYANLSPQDQQKLMAIMPIVVDAATPSSGGYRGRDEVTTEIGQVTAWVSSAAMPEY